MVGVRLFSSLQGGSVEFARKVQVFAVSNGYERPPRIVIEIAHGHHRLLYVADLAEFAGFLMEAREALEKYLREWAAEAVQFACDVRGKDPEAAASARHSAEIAEKLANAISAAQPTRTPR